MDEVANGAENGNALTVSDKPSSRWPKDVLSNIKEAREFRGLTHDQCSKLLGLSSSGQYTRREEGETAFQYEEMERLRVKWDLPKPWPHISLQEALWLTNERLKRGASGVSEMGVSQRLHEYMVRTKTLPDHIAAEMDSRANLDRGDWDDSDIDMLWLIVERHARRKRK